MATDSRNESILTYLATSEAAASGATVAQIAQALNLSPEDVVQCIGELRRAGLAMSAGASAYTTVAVTEGEKLAVEALRKEDPEVWKNMLIFFAGGGKK